MDLGKVQERGQIIGCDRTGKKLALLVYGESDYNERRSWRYRLMVRTEPSQGLNTGSIPVSATI